MMTAVTLDDIKQDNQIAANWLLNYENLKRQYEQDYADAMSGRQVVDNIGGSRSGVGNPTLSKVVRITDILETEKWLQTVEDIHKIIGEKKLIFLCARREAVHLPPSREKGRPAWVVYTQQQCAERMARRYNASIEKCWLSERTMREWWMQIVNLTVRIAMKRNCL